MDDDIENYYSSCMENAISAIESGDYDEAKRFLYKAKLINPTEEVTDLLEYIKSVSPTNPSTSESANIRQRAKSNTINDDYTEHTEYTKEQLEIVEKIKKCKDFYEVLDVKKDATILEIKKAYKKLALQLHPDKNRAPGASEAFKAIGNAVATLTDSQKRKEYDLFGLQQNQKSSTSFYNGRRHNNYEYAYERGFEADISAEELFNIFFGNGFTQFNSRRTTFFNNNDDNEDLFNIANGQYYYRRRDITQQSSVAFALILLFIVMSILSSFLTSDPIFSLGQT